ncbi:MBL fold metallo-hydrolase [Candidatus Bathyarchaeota archaeon]|jgi:glyoxylase-like metal-dependent hydrolase (beta-lactamase superfamily II)|nr:MBL fold metallo-hydrolase [Candidatus Bathyarchaeota archaeon]
MRVKILGSRAKVESSESRYSQHSGAIIDGVILLDLGEKGYLDLDPDYILITHLHPDHAVFVNEDLGKINVPVYAPEKTKEAEVQVLKESISLNGYNTTPIPTHHSKLVESQAYLVENEGSRLLYTGDIIWIDKKYHDKISDLNVVITDASYIRKGGLVRKDEETGKLYGHNGIPNLVKLFKGLTEHIVFTHFGSWFYRDIEESKEKIREFSEQDLKVESAYDGFEIEV